MTYFMTADEHFGHFNIIRYTKRPFDSVEEMDETLINNHNSVVSKEDLVIHAGDFTLAKRDIAEKYISKLNGKHLFLRGSHDRWLPNNAPYIYEKMIQEVYVVVCHYAMRTWPRSHYGSLMCFGHSHGTLIAGKNQYDVGVDNNSYFPISLEDVLKKVGVCNCLMCKASKEMKGRE